MRLLVINCSPRVKANSNTALMLDAFLKGFTENGSSAEVYHLSEMGKWDEIRAAFDESDNILMAMPLFVECVPGILLEFLDTLAPKPLAGGRPAARLSFILQGGFAEASQLRCGEAYLEKLPEYLGCEYGGTLIKGNMFITHMMPPETYEKMLAPFENMGRRFAETGRFDKDEVSAFAAPEYLSKGYQVFFTLISPMQKAFFHFFFKKHGMKGSLRAKPYKEYLE